MRTIQMTLDEELVARVDRVTRRMRISRSAFARHALREALRGLRTRALEKRHRDGYRRKPVRRGEFSDWETEQAWGEL